MLHYLQLLAQWLLLGTAVYFATQATSAPACSHRSASPESCASFFGALFDRQRVVMNLPRST